MKKIAVLETENNYILNAVLKYFENKNIEIVSISNSQINFEYLSSCNFDLIALVDYSKNLSKENLSLSKFINIHPSLLPAFNENNSIQKAFTSGVKVSGITIHWIDEASKNKIIAQYPVLIGNLTHFDEFEKEIHNLGELLYPIVIDKILNDEVFDFQDLMSSGGCSKTGCGKSGNCGGCGGCN